MSTPTPSIGKRYTYKDYLQIEDEKRYEVMEGGLVMVPAPLTIHQRVSRNIEVILCNFVKEKRLGEILYAPMDVVLSEDVVVQPDILFISKKRLNIIEEAAIMGSPDLIIEVVSPFSASYDTIEKRGVYEKYGVKEYWLVFPQEKVVEVLTLEKNIYREFCKARKIGVIRSKVLDGLVMDLTDIIELEGSKRTDSKD
ncbi:MAG: Uma2 family endonuclease [Nitrospirae bacterium]|nr:Uma2 family endonuclease [Nitrospirota bacterium]